MDGPSLIFIIVPITISIALSIGMALPLISGRRPGHSDAQGRSARAHDLKLVNAAKRKARPPKPGAHHVPAGYLYVPCARIRYHGYPAETRRWVQEVPIVKMTATLIYYASDSWDRGQAVVSPGCISREQFETDTRCRGGYPAGVIPIPGDRHRPGPAGGLFFASRAAAEDDLYHGQRDRAERVGSEARPIRELRRAMADAHPDRGGTAEQFIQARRRYQAAIRRARRQCAHLAGPRLT
jgi:hypothetical protein